MIDAYFNDFRLNKKGEVACAAQESARAFCKRNAEAIRDHMPETWAKYKIGDIAGEAIPYVEGFEAGVKWALSED